MARTRIFDANLRPTANDRDVRKLVRDGLELGLALKQALMLREQNIRAALPKSRKAIVLSHRGTEQGE